VDGEGYPAKPGGDASIFVIDFFVDLPWAKSPQPISNHDEHRTLRRIVSFPRHADLMPPLIMMSTGLFPELRLFGFFGVIALHRLFSNHDHHRTLPAIVAEQIPLRHYITPDALQSL
jgi:hypothetical protein